MGARSRRDAPALGATLGRWLGGASSQGILLALVAATVLLPNLGGGSLADWDEAYYGGIARDLGQGAPWWILRSNGVAIYDKPPLFVWLIALVGPVLGQGELAVRFWAATFGILGVALTYWLGRDTHGPWVGLMGAIILASMPGYLSFAGQGMLDVPVATTGLLCLLAFHRSLHSPRYTALAVGAVALGFALKFGAGLLPLPALLLYCLWRRDMGWWRRPPVLLGALIITSLALALVGLTLVTPGGATALNGFGFNRIFALDANGSDLSPITYYGEVLAQGLGTWVLLAALATLHLGYRLVRGARDGDVLLGSWLLVIVVVFFPAPTKLPWYIVSLYPALALQVATLLGEFLEPGAHLARAMVLGAAAWRIYGLGPLAEVPALGRGAVALAVVGALVLALGGRRFPGSLRGLDLRGPWVRRSPVLMVAFLLVSPLHIAAVQDHNPQVKILALQAQQRLGPDDQLVVFSPSIGSHANAAHFYSDRIVLEVTDGSQAEALLRSPTPVVMLTTERDLAAIARDVHYEVVQSEDPWLLITNAP